MPRSNRKQGTKQALHSKRRESKLNTIGNSGSLRRIRGDGTSIMETCSLCWDKVPKSATLIGSAWGISGTICKECITYVGNDAFQESLKPNLSSLYEPTYEMDWSYYGNDWDASASTFNGPSTFVQCHHHMVPFTFEGLDDTYTVYLTGNLALSHEPSVTHLPTVGVYLDDSWFANRIASNTSSELDLKQPASLYVGWADFGIIERGLLSEAIEWLIPYLHNKSNIIEIAISSCKSSRSHDHCIFFVP